MLTTKQAAHRTETNQTKPNQELSSHLCNQLSLNHKRTPHPLTRIIHPSPPSQREIDREVRAGMGDMSPFDKNLSSSQDEISLFLRQILLRSSSSSHAQSHRSCNSNASPLQDGKISALDSNPAYLSPSHHAANVSSSSVGVNGNDTDDYDCESEEGVEILTEEVPTKSVPSTSRSSSKRSRAAEVHNLSEKRRRSRINEKMKALQNLIPNSNKTDKASMLDEFIEYLKQLQLQVQMLSMRNGLSLHPMCIPEGLQPLPLSRMSMELSEGNRSTPLKIAPTLPLPQENPLLYASNLPNKHTLPNQPSVPYPSYINNTVTSFGLESRIPAQKKPFQRSLEPIHSEDMSQHQQSSAFHSVTNPFGSSQGVHVLKSFSPDYRQEEVPATANLKTEKSDF